MGPPQIREGKLQFKYGEETYETYYKIAGALSPASPAPLVFVHGAPGSCHDYALPLCDLASGARARPVIFYDQIGSARSTHLPHKPASFWSLDLYIAELQNVVRGLGVAGAYHLVGHSWGGQVAAELIVRHHPKGVKSVVLTNTLSSATEYFASVERMQRAMGDAVWGPIEKHEREGTTDNPEYGAALMAFYQAHACRVEPFPEEFLYTISQMAGDGEKIWEAIKETYYHDWNIDDRIHLIDVPALLINGEYDYMSDAVCGPFFWRVDRIKWVKFARSSHMPFWEERERYMEVVGGFLNGVDA